MDIKDIKNLIITIDNTSIEKVEIEKSDIKIMITKSESGSVAKTSSKSIGVTNIQGDKQFKEYYRYRFERQ
ncbi:hypothetical protein [Proteiniborus sp. MB09-C3]|uniref:hypothetical protein n=1 Tax=Proteiniborus sp. MB09-C3 TaxID=3050072 RepID=UPI0025528E58|nr:hypothetical protein [Proteiniborus sp. MB09-C3]WIV13356.1 hypothetical protein QO263_06505 [Proteiniborus sp. MB09-C3]